MSWHLRRKGEQRSEIHRWTDKENKLTNAPASPSQTFRAIIPKTEAETAFKIQNYCNYRHILHVQTYTNKGTNKHTHTEECSTTSILLPDPAAMAGKDDVEAEVEASAGGSRFGVPNGSDGAGRLLDGGCWMVWMECPPSMEGRLCGPS